MFFTLFISEGYLMNRAAIVSSLALALGFAGGVHAGDTYKADPVHSSTIFRAKHAGASYVFGRFNDPAGTFVLDDADPTKDTFEVEIPVDNVDTHNDKRDAHLKSPDFFNAKQYPTITFKSTSVAKGDGPFLNVTGTLEMHGVTKTITIPVELVGKGEFPPGVARAGVEAAFVVKTSDFEIKGLPGAVSESIWVIVALEGIKQ